MACAGAVSPDTMLFYILGEQGDPDGEFCTLAPTGQPLNQGYYGLTFASGFPLEQMASLSGVISSVIVDGSYNDAMRSLGNFPQARPNCAGYNLGAASAGGVLNTGFEADALQLQDFAGIFILLGAGMAASVGIKLALLHATHAARASRACATQLCGGGGGGGGGDARSSGVSPALPLPHLAPAEGGDVVRAAVATALAEHRAAAAASAAELDARVRALLGDDAPAPTAARAPRAR